MCKLDYRLYHRKLDYCKTHWFTGKSTGVLLSVSGLLLCVLCLPQLQMYPCFQGNKDICRLRQSAHLFLFQAWAPAISGTDSTSPKALENLSLGSSESSSSSVFSGEAVVLIECFKEFLICCHISKMYPWWMLIRTACIWKLVKRPFMKNISWSLSE